MKMSLTVTVKYASMIKTKSVHERESGSRQQSVVTFYLNKRSVVARGKK